ncbi:E3 SUMO-protein like [Actinidia chinensis var. chinensis]|uniref:E3 SUMO-protein like n=1 Tax=Actinidia chinensis var. chinensis TaxID=1590841 RepID=A0A2R6QW50_ACTCC|nr:E3 SUMO-protein like [Actinidia chinensis var. chinensis]
MASTSAASRPNGVAGRFQSAATTLFSDNQSLISIGSLEIRKVMITMKDGAVDLERRNQSQMVTQLHTSSFKSICIQIPSYFASWNVHHAGQPLPGEEQEDLVMTSTQSNLLNINCPLTGKPITELATPVRSVDCKHIYEKDAIMPYIRSKNPHSQCPVAGCPKILVAERVVCDPLLLVEIDEMRYKQSARTDVVEDFTNEEDSG